MINQRRCPCCVGKEPEYHQHISRRSQKGERVERIEKIDNEMYMQGEQQFQQTETKPYAYLGEGEVWVNGAFMNVLNKKCGSGAHVAHKGHVGQPIHAGRPVHMCCHPSPCASPCHASPVARQPSPTRVMRVQSPVVCRCCSPMKMMSPMRPMSPSRRMRSLTKRRSASPPRQRRGKSPTKSSCTYRVLPVKSKSDIRDGDLIIETSKHKYLKVIGPEERSDGDDFFVLIDPSKKTKRRARSSSTTGYSTSSDEEIPCTKQHMSPHGKHLHQVPCQAMTGPCFCICCTGCPPGQGMMMK